MKKNDTVTVAEHKQLSLEGKIYFFLENDPLKLSKTWD